MPEHQLGKLEHTQRAAPGALAVCVALIMAREGFFSLLLLNCAAQEDFFPLATRFPEHINEIKLSSLLCFEVLRRSSISPSNAALRRG